MGRNELAAYQTDEKLLGLNVDAIDKIVIHQRELEPLTVAKEDGACQVKIAGQDGIEGLI